MNNQQKTTDNKYTASKYIIKFHELIIQLNQQKSILKNLLKETKAIYTATKKIKLTINQQTQIKQQATNTTFLADQAYTQYKTITKTLKLTENQKKEEKKLEKLNQHLNENIIPNQEILDEFVILLNHFLISEAMKELTTNSQTILQEIYNN